jgi:hypothetical protein
VGKDEIRKLGNMTRIATTKRLLDVSTDRAKVSLSHGIEAHLDCRLMLCRPSNARISTG